MYVIKQETGFTPYFLAGWGEKTESFSALLRDAHQFPNMQAAIDVMEAIAKRWRIRNGSPIVPLKVVPANTNHGQVALRVVTSNSQRLNVRTRP